jgi:hypothetical protein
MEGGPELIIIYPQWFADEVKFENSEYFAKRTLYLSVRLHSECFHSSQVCDSTWCATEESMRLTQYFLSLAFLLTSGIAQAMSSGFQKPFRCCSTRKQLYPEKGPKLGPKEPCRLRTEVDLQWPINRCRMCDSGFWHSGKHFMVIVSKSGRNRKYSSIPCYRFLGTSASRYAENRGLLPMTSHTTSCQNTPWEWRDFYIKNLYLLSGYVNSKNTCVWPVSWYWGWIPPSTKRMLCYPFA